MTSRLPLDLAAIFMFVGALFHVACLFGGADWLLFAGAPKEFAESYRAGAVAPIVWTLAIALMLTIWGFYARSGAGRMRRLPLLKTGLGIIGTLMTLRGAVGIVLLFVTKWPWHTAMGVFHAIASIMIFGVGLFYFAGLYRLWKPKAQP